MSTKNIALSRGSSIILIARWMPVDTTDGEVVSGVQRGGWDRPTCCLLS